MITLPDAIRKGAQLQPQAFGDYLAVLDANPVIYGTCAIGAAIAGVYGQPLTDFDHFPEDIDEFFEAETGCNISTMLVSPQDNPLPRSGDQSLFGVLTQLNDQAHWIREAIADWVESWLLKQNSYERWEQQ